jgi:hypothetical protein
MKNSPATMTSMMTVSLMATMTRLTREDSLMPAIRIPVRISTMIIAGRFITGSSPAIQLGR